MDATIRSAACWLPALLLTACASGGETGPHTEPRETHRVRTVAETHPLPVLQEADGGTSADGETGADRPGRPLTALTWNLGWFGDPLELPVDDEEAYGFALEVLATQNADIVALQEICDGEALDRLLADLPGYAGLLASYQWRQRIALLWSDERFTLAAARGLHGLDDAGRPPLEVRLRGRDDGVDLWVIAVHAKADQQPESRDTRERFALGLLEHLQERRAGEPLLLLGDINDRLLASIVEGEPSPYRAWLDADELIALTAELDGPDAAEPSTRWGDTVDHVFASRALLDTAQPVRVEVLRDELLAIKPDFLDTVSDHFPVRVTLFPAARDHRDAL